MSCDNRSQSRSLAKRMRADDPDQFQTLVRMHLSFVLDLTLSDTEADGAADKPKIRPLKWGIAPFTKKWKSMTKESNKEDEIPAAPLSRSTVAQVTKLVDFLHVEEKIVHEGIFRRSGKLTRQQELKAALAKNADVDLNSYSIHDVASVLKTILSELPEPLLTETYHPAYTQIAELSSGEQSANQSTRVLRSLQLLFLLLPRENRRLLKNILRLLHFTASHEASNRMSAQNLATLFTPHLLVSRKLSPEAFHTTAGNLSCVTVFMINESNQLFGVPEALATDIHAYWEGKRKNTFLERSISEAKTVFSFTDRELSQREDAVNPTETALAQLYAHIQSLPESSQKKRLIKQFNKENGNGTPRTKSIGVSIKKHIFSKNAKAKGYTDYLNLKNAGMSPSSNSILNSPERKLPRTPLTAKLRLNLGSCSDGKGSNKRSPSLAEELTAETTDDSLSTTGSPIGDLTPSGSPAPPPGSNDYSKESETRCGSERFKPLSARKLDLDFEGDVLGAQPGRLGTPEFIEEDSRGEEGDSEEQWGDRRIRRRDWGRGGLADVTLPGLPFLSKCPHRLSGRSQLLVKNGGLRPLVVRRRHGAPSLGLASLHTRRGISIIDQEFWHPPKTGSKTFLGRTSDEWEEG